MSEIATFAVEPMSSRFCFKIRTLINFTISAVICSFIVAVLSLALPFWIADLVALSVTLYVYVAVLNKRPLKIRCENCRKFILSNTPWVCGFCNAKNENADDYPFVYQCRHCSAQPKAYKCHHRNCGALIFLSEDRLEGNYAYCVNSQMPIISEPKSVQRQEELQELNHAISMAELDSRLATIKKQREQVQPKAPLEQKKESLDRHYAMTVAARELAKKKKAEAADTFKDDPEGLKDAVEAIDDWLERNIG